MVYSYLKFLHELLIMLGHLEILGTRLTDNSIISKLKQFYRLFYFYRARTFSQLKKEYRQKYGTAKPNVL